MGQVKIKNLAGFCWHLATLLEVGLPLRDALQVIKEQKTGKVMDQVTEGIIKRLDQGSSFSEAIEAYSSVLPPTFLAMVEAGELTGRLEEVLQSLALYYQKEHQFGEKVKSVMVYPAILITTSFIVVSFIFFYIVPVFANVLKGLGGELPALTKGMLFTSQMIRDHYILLLFLLMGMLLFCKFFNGTRYGQDLRDRILLYLPGLGVINKKILAARFCRALGALLTGGVPVLQALEVSKKITANNLYGKVITGAQVSLSSGGTLAEPLWNLKIFPPALVRMVALGEATGTLENVLDKASISYEGEVEEAMGRFVTLLEPLMTVFLAILVGLIVFSVLMPIFEIYSQVY